MDKKIFKFVIVLLFSVLAIGLRALFINLPLWYDEACSWFSASQTFPIGIFDNLLHLDIQHTPLYFILLHFWITCFGDSELVLRLFSLIFATASIPLVYFTSKKITTKNLALATTAIAAFSPLLVFFSTEVRMYPMTVFLVLVSINALVNYEKDHSVKNLIKLVIANVLIPYTLVGGILYTISVATCYGYYIWKNQKDKFSLYLKGLLAEIGLLIPYFILIYYYAMQRKLFVIKHEGFVHFSNIIDIFRNFFGTNIIDNIYWPSTEPYVLTFSFTIFVIVPCVYIIYGFIQGLKHSKSFEKVLYWIAVVNFTLFCIASFAQINILTVRYILYLLPILILLSIIGLSKKISNKHLNIFIIFFVTCSIFSNINYYKFSKYTKPNALKAVRIESDNLKLNTQDMIIMPFSSDAPYYFKDNLAPQVYNFDFHKEVRNPYNPRFYTPEQQKVMDKEAKYRDIFDGIHSDYGFSSTHYLYFKENVLDKVTSGRYILLALYSNDSSSLVSLDEIKKAFPSIQEIKMNTLGAMFTKYLYDIRLYLESECNYLGLDKKDNYTYLLFQKR